MAVFDKQIFRLETLMSTPQVLDDGGVMVFAETDGGLDKQTRCAVLTNEDYDDAEDDMSAVVISGVNMSELLSVDAFEQIIGNANLQRRSPGPELLLEALSFYFENDAFIDFDESGL